MEIPLTINSNIFNQIKYNKNNKIEHLLVWQYFAAMAKKRQNHCRFQIRDRKKMKKKDKNDYLACLLSILIVGSRRPVERIG